MERASVLKRGDTITREDLPEKLVRKPAGVSEILLNLPEGGLSLEELEKDLIMKALEKHKAIRPAPRSTFALPVPR